jgi:hypothetical protein
MTAPREFGVPGVHLRPAEHLCGVFGTDAERDQVLLPFFRAGIQNGDRCVMVLDRDDPAEPLAALGDHREVAYWQQTGMLELRTTADQQRTAAGLSRAQMLDTWETAIAEAISSSYPFTRLGGEVSWWLPQAAESTLVTYESELNRLIPDRMAVLCLYDLRQFGGNILIDAVRAHPAVLVSGQLVENPYYLSPDEFLAVRGGAPARPTPEEFTGLLKSGS